LHTLRRGESENRLAVAQSGPSHALAQTQLPPTHWPLYEHAASFVQLVAPGAASTSSAAAHRSSRSMMGSGSP